MRLGSVGALFRGSFDMLSDCLKQFIPPPPAPLLGTTGTELLLFGLLIAGGVWLLHREGRTADRFVGLSLVGTTLFYLICPENSTLQRHVGDVLMHTMAWLQAALMKFGGTDVTAEGISVIGSTAFTLARGCLGLSYLAMGVIVLMAYPAPWRRRLAGAGILAGAMIWLNAFRLILLYHLWDLREREAYALFHRVGGGFFALVVFGLFLGALTARPLKRSAAPAAAGAGETVGA